MIRSQIRTVPESCEKYTDPDGIRKTSDLEPWWYPSHSGSPKEGSEPVDTDGTEDTDDGDAIMVGAVGSAAPWFLTGWTNDVEVEFMIDTGFQVTILATSRKNVQDPPASKNRTNPVYATASVS